MNRHLSSPIGTHYLCDITQQAVIWARQAGQIALYHFRKASPTKKADDSLLTQADLDIEQFLIAQIQRHYPDHTVLAEEQGPDQLPPDSPYIWAIDPLDGTTAFVQGLPGWGVSLGLLYRGQPVLGLFHMPLLDDLTYSCAGYPFGFCKGIPLDCLHQGHSSAAPLCPHPRSLGQAVRSDWDNNGFLAVSAGAHQDFQINLPRTRALGSVGASLIYTARGSATAAFIPKAYLWDIAAGGLILTQAGGELRYLSGRPVNYAALLDGRHAPEPIIAGHPAVVAELKETIRLRHLDIVSC